VSTLFSRALFKCLRLVRRPFPAAVRRQVRLVFFRWLDLTWELSGGLRARLTSYTDWVVYNEIFVHGEYDKALSFAFDAAARHTAPIHIVDVGANVGFFTLRAVQQLAARGFTDRGYGVTAVEGDGECAREFAARVFEENRLSSTVTLTHGLVGRRDGAAKLHGDSLFRRDTRGVEVPFVDLDLLLSAVPRIDLLKCDIEGAELLFIENYPDLLRKVNVAVFELHSNLCDIDRCRKLLTEYGFTHGQTHRAGDPYSLYCVWR
jgi:FkbM family methyltransferase